MTCLGCCLCSMRSRRSEAGWAVHDVSPTHSSLIEATTTTSTGTRSETVALCPRSLDGGPGTARGWALTGGGSNGALRGCTDSGVFDSGGNAELTSMRRSSNSPAVSRSPAVRAAVLAADCVRSCRYHPHAGLTQGRTGRVVFRRVGDDHIQVFRIADLHHAGSRELTLVG